MMRAVLVIVFFWHFSVVADELNFAEKAEAGAIQNLHDFHAQSAIAQPYFIELFTSQGCSSCPPADRWLSEFKEETELWQTYFPIAFHVTYWDYIGWKDPFADRRYSQRQYDHLNQLNIGQVYTPQFVVNGKEWRGWFNRVLGSTFKQAAREVGVLQADIKGTRLMADFQSMIDVEDQVVELHVALLGASLTTEVNRGENKNKVLQHDFTALAHQVFDAQKSTKNYQVIGQVDETFLSSANRLKNSNVNNRMALLIWIELDNKPVQAVGAWLE